ncbi:MAG: valine--tRNA ligase [Alphaproteobacteria bacterium]|nr:MAG: valine--tRNA ligase [Alphaproteobacteria bacterium]
MLDKTYNPRNLENKWIAAWDESGLTAGNTASGKKPYVIMMPPPNVTGSLHMGHALNYTLQDIMIRYKRLKGMDAFWQPGMDHAGIATQMIVERQLAEEKRTRHDLGRDAFIARVWEWRAESGNRIFDQQRRLGITPDWKRARFTMDEGLNEAVREVFVRLYNEGLIYRAERLVNWDVVLQTAVSDLEVETKDIKGHYYHIAYPLCDSKDSLVIATTRPETLFGDTAIAVNPKDERYAHLVGKKVRVPLTDRTIPVIADDYSDPEKGTGAVKITPAHDFNDFEVGRRHGLPHITVMDKGLRLLPGVVPERFVGLDRYAARKAVVAALDATDQLITVEETTRPVPHSQRSGVEVEPYMTLQWFMNVEPLAAKAIQAVEEGKTKFVPEKWTATYFEWMRNIQPWCISRQIWWGHQIPVWYGPDEAHFVAHDEEEAQKLAIAHYGEAVSLRRDADVLDTWFSSALWPFSTLGWPHQTTELARYYPGDVLVTGFDIIFFWVARMMMMGIHCMGEVPFHTVYMNALVRDEHGQKMSKSKGNVIDPLVLIDKYGSDALRFGMASYAAPGVDIKFKESQIEGYRNFGTKLWNVARLCEHYQCQYRRAFDPCSVTYPVNQWIVDQVYAQSRVLEAHLENYRFDRVTHSVYQFVWGAVCDWYVELAKPALQNNTHKAHRETQETLMWVLRQVLIFVNPLMPFVTEEIHAHFYAEEGMLIATEWPSFSEALEADKHAIAGIDTLIRLIKDLRGLRADAGIAPGKGLDLLVETNSQLPFIFAQFPDLCTIVAKINTITPATDFPDQALQFVFDGTTIHVPVMHALDSGEERKRLEKELAAFVAECDVNAQKLANKNFVSRASPDAVAKIRARHDAAQAAQEKILQALKRLPH